MPGAVAAELNTQRVLLALRAAECSYRCHPEDPHRWRAECIGCRRWSLYITEDPEDGTLVLGCSRRCRGPVALRRLLSVSPISIHERRQTEKWRHVAEWAIAQLKT